jgi:TPR repeat protein
LIADGDISGARLMLERALADGSDRAAFQLAETYDPRMLLEWNVVGLTANTARARELYGIAADRGVTAAKERLVGLD